MTTFLQKTSATCWMGEQGLRDCDYVSKECERYLLDGEQGLRDCEHLSTKRECYLLDGEAGVDGL